MRDRQRCVALDQAHAIRARRRDKPKHASVVVTDQVELGSAQREVYSCGNLRRQNGPETTIVAEVRGVSARRKYRLGEGHNSTHFHRRAMPLESSRAGYMRRCGSRAKRAAA